MANPKQSELIPMIENRNIALKREGDKLLLPTYDRKEVPASFGIVAKPYLMCRVISHNEATGVLQLALSPDILNERSFDISKQENSAVLTSLFITAVVFVKPLVNNIPFTRKEYKDPDYKARLIRESEVKPTIPKTINLSIERSVKELIFEDGRVLFSHYIPEANKKVQFEIQHPFLKREHDSIKNYFPKALNRDTFSISIEFKLLSGAVIDPTCNSPHLSMIDEKLFELVAEMYIEDTILSRHSDDITTLDQLALELSNATGLEELQDPNLLLNKLITPERTKHYYHLRYLSDKHISNRLKLKITGTPVSYIFLLQETTDYYLIWETYSTEEATYIWRLTEADESKLPYAIDKHIDLIKWLRKGHKLEYLKTKPDNFKKIEHEYNLVDLGFKKWLAQLTGFLILKEK